MAAKQEQQYHRPPPPLPLESVLPLTGKQERSRCHRPPPPLPRDSPAVSMKETQKQKESASENFPFGRKPFEIYEELTTPVSSRKKLDEIVQNCALPVRLSACDSIYGIAGAFTFLTEDTIDIHFKKESLIATVKLSTGEKIKIPINSDFRLSVIYDSACIVDNHQTTAQLMKTSPLPNLVTVEKGCKDCKKSSGFFEGEVLILRKFINPKTIECFSLLTGTEKKIHKSTKVHFVVNPSDSMLSLADVEHLNLPLQAYLHPSKAKLRDVFSTPCTIESLNKEVSVLASFSDDKKTVQEFLKEKNIYEIFVHLPLEFQFAQLLEKESQLLFQKSKVLYDVFSPTHVKKVIIHVLPAVGNRWFQGEVYQMPQNGEGWKRGTKLFPPVGTKEKVSSKKNVSLHHREEYELLSETADYTPLNPDTIHVGYMYTKRNADIPEYEKIDKLPESRSYSIDSQHKSPEKGIKKEQSSICSVSYNKLKLENLSQKQVIELLKILGLTQYKKAFTKEGISGALLQDLDEEVLKTELGITSRLHRIKLLRVIDGRQSLDELFGCN